MLFPLQTDLQQTEKHGGWCRSLHHQRACTLRPTHPRRFSTRIEPKMMARLKEINWKYVAEDICMAIIPTVLRKPDVGEQQQAVTTGVIIGWMASRTGMNREYTPQKVNAAMKKLQFKPKKTNKGNVYFVVRLLADDLKHAGELLANQEFKKEVEADIPF